MDRKREAASGLVREYKKAAPWKFGLVIVLGMAACLAGTGILAVAAVIAFAGGKVKL